MFILVFILIGILFDKVDKEQAYSHSAVIKSDGKVVKNEDGNGNLTIC